MPNAPKSDSKKSATLQERLEAFAQLHPGKAFLIVTEQDASELLTLLAIAIRAAEKEISKPMELEGDEMDDWRKKYNAGELLRVRQAANKMLKAARAGGGSAMAFCLEEFSHTPLEYLGITIVFPPLEVARDETVH